MIFQKKLLESELRFDTSSDKLYRFNKKWNIWTWVNPVKCYNKYYKKDIFNKVLIDKKKFLIYRLIYYVRYDNFDIFDTKIQIDHINSDQNDNRLENLRTCTGRQNCQNKKHYKNKEVKGYTVTKWGTFCGRYVDETGKTKTKTFKKEEDARNYYLQNTIRF